MRRHLTHHCPTCRERIPKWLEICVNCKQVEDRILQYAESEQGRLFLRAVLGDDTPADVLQTHAEELKLWRAVWMPQIDEANNAMRVNLKQRAQKELYALALRQLDDLTP